MSNSAGAVYLSSWRGRPLCLAGGKLLLQRSSASRPEPPALSARFLREGALLGAASRSAAAGQGRRAPALNFHSESMGVLLQCKLERNQLDRTAAIKGGMPTTLYISLTVAREKSSCHGRNSSWTPVLIPSRHKGQSPSPARARLRTLASPSTARWQSVVSCNDGS